MRLAACLLIALCLGAIAHADDLVSYHDYQSTPDRITLLREAGEQAYRSGHYHDSASLLTRYCDICIGDWQALAELCEARQAAGETHAAQVAANRLRSWWQHGTCASLSGMDRFRREQIPVPGGEVSVYEVFSQTAATRWIAVASDERGCPQRITTYRTSAQGTLVDTVDLAHPQRNRTTRLTSRITSYANLQTLLRR